MGFAHKKSNDNESEKVSDGADTIISEDDWNLLRAGSREKKLLKHQLHKLFLIVFFKHFDHFLIHQTQVKVEFGNRKCILMLQYLASLE